MPAKKPSTKKYLDISEIKDDVIVMNDGTLRAVIMCSSLNFALKGEDEQKGIIGGYIQFLNSLDHTLQVVVQSRKLDIDNYLRSLEDVQKKQTNELLKIQIVGYLDFVKELIEIGEIMTKKFYLIVPFNPVEFKQQTFFSRLKQVFAPGRAIKIKREKFLEYKEKLGLRVNNVLSNLNSMGLDSVVLDTQSLIELSYNVYNPKTSQNQKMGDVAKLRIET